MKRLVDTGNLADAQYDELQALLAQARIPVHETRTHLFAFGALWVADEDFARAQEILRQESASFAQGARAEWEQRWREDYRGSTLHWLWHRAWEDPAGLLARVLLLAVAVGGFVLYPLYYAMTRGAG
jgi:hypothetical protein